MSNKNNILPFILALASTLVVLGLGYGMYRIVSLYILADKDSDAEPKIDTSVIDRDRSNETIPAISFSEPGIVPMGTSVRINGSKQMEEVNNLLKKSFQREFPGTNVNIDADGNETGMRLLLSGQIDLAAISRPLNKEEQAQGLTAVAIGENNDSESLFYAYREPANIKVEAFLGYLFSVRGQEAIIDRNRSE